MKFAILKMQRKDIPKKLQAYIYYEENDTILVDRLMLNFLDIDERNLISLINVPLEKYIEEGKTLEELFPLVARDELPVISKISFV